VKVLIDAQLPPALASWLRARGTEANHVVDLDMLRASDQEIWDRALVDGYALVTKDRDFADWAITRSPAPRIIWLRRGNQDTMALLDWLEDAWPRIVEALDDGARVVEAGR
jgi:predicted nuclease of predicted toxin-antitoxin system